MYAQQPPGPVEVKVRHKTHVSVLYIVLGSLLLLIALIALLVNLLSFWIVLGPLLLAAGIVSMSVPCIRFNPATATLTVHGPFGNRVRTFGAPKNERIVFDGTRILRLAADGRAKTIRTSSGNAEDVRRLQQVLASMQQQPPQ